MIGSRSVRWRRISNDALPEPMMMAARNSVTGTPCAASSLPVCWRLARWGERLAASVAEPAEVDDAPHTGRRRRPWRSCAPPAGRGRRSRAPPNPSSGRGSTPPRRPPRRGRASQAPAGPRGTAVASGKRPASGRTSRLMSTSWWPSDGSTDARRPPMYPLAPTTRMRIAQEYAGTARVARNLHRPSHRSNAHFERTMR